MNKATLGYAMTGSFCTFEKSLAQLQTLLDAGYAALPILSFHAAQTDTRFGKAAEFVRRMEDMTGHAVLQTLTAVEPLGPKKLCDLLIVLPCTGNTLGKLAAGIYDTPVTLAVKSVLRAGRPVLLGVSTNDALEGSGKSIGTLLARKNIFFVPMAQDAPRNKPRSVVCDFSKTLAAAEAALRGEQLQPMIF